MRMRLGILHDAEAQQRMHDREQKAIEQKKQKAETPTVRTEVEQRKHEEEQADSEKKGVEKKKEEKAPKVKIRPLSEAKAIELGANFFSEAFIFAVAAGLLVWDSWRSRRKESARRDDVADRLADLETEVTRLRSKYEPGLEMLQEKVVSEPKASWWNPAGWWARTEPPESRSEEAQGHAIPGNVPVQNPEKAVKATLTPGPKIPDPKHEPVLAAEGTKKPTGPSSTETMAKRVDLASAAKNER